MKLSLITINYNNKVGLGRTVDSVVTQIAPPFEWIIIDGGSTDGSKEIIDAHKNKLSYWCSEHDSGVYHAMNKGVTQAHGDYVLFLNSGDTFINETVVDDLISYTSHADILYGNCVHIDNTKRLGIEYPKELSIFDLYYANLCHQATLIKTELLRKYPYDENLKIAADYKNWLIWMLNDYSFEHLPITICKFYLDGISSINTDMTRFETEKIRESVIPLYILHSLRQHEQLIKEVEWSKRRLPKMLALFMSLVQRLYDNR